jgi:hypothetical protein
MMRYISRMADAQRPTVELPHPFTEAAAAATTYSVTTKKRGTTENEATPLPMIERPGVEEARTSVRSARPPRAATAADPSPTATDVDSQWRVEVGPDRVWLRLDGQRFELSYDDAKRIAELLLRVTAR